MKSEVIALRGHVSRVNGVEEPALRHVESCVRRAAPRPVVRRSSLLSTSVIPANRGEGAITWARFDDNYDSNPKIRMAGRDAKNLHEVSIRWSCRLRTSGRIPRPVLPELGILAFLPGSKLLHQRAADRLVEVNLWEDQGEAWHIHDFEKYGPPLSALSHAQRVARATDEPWLNHAPIPNPSPTRPVGSLEQLRERAVGRGVAPESVESRLAELQQQVEDKGAKNWLPYVQTGYQGQACLFDQAVSRWLEEDHQILKHAPTPDYGLRLRRVEPA